MSVRTDLHLVLPSKSKIPQLFHKFNIHELVCFLNFRKWKKCTNLIFMVCFLNFVKWKKWLEGENIKLLESRCVLVNRCDWIMCKWHVNYLRHIRKGSHKMTEKVKKRVRMINNTVIVIHMKGLTERDFLGIMKF